MSAGTESWRMNPTAEQVLDYLIGWQCCEPGAGNYIVAIFPTHCEGGIRIIFEIDENGKRKYRYVEHDPDYAGYDSK